MHAGFALAFDSDLVSWLGHQGFAGGRAEALAGDVSARRYFRLRLADSRTAILAVYPEEIRETCTRFRRTTELLESARVPVPRVLAEDCHRGWMLIDDLGEQTLYDLSARPWSELASLFSQALVQGARIATIPAESVAGLNPPLDTALLRRELQRTMEIFLAPRGYLSDAADAAEIAASFDSLCARLGDAAPAVCHRDFMARNLVPRPGSAGGLDLWVLDHQDLRLGPPGYDVASLLNDSLFPPPAVAARLLHEAGADAEAYHRVAAQRTLKAVGTYAIFAARGNLRHVSLIGPTFRRALHHLERTPEGRSAATLLRRAPRPGTDDSIC